MEELDDVRSLLRTLQRRLVAGEIAREQYRELIDDVTVGLAPSERAELGLTPTPMPGGTPHPLGPSGKPRVLGPSGARSSGMETRLERLADLEIKAGDVLLDKFRIVRELGRGGFGAVFEAEEVRLGDRLAVKVLDPAMVARVELLARFRREVQLMRKLVHPHIARVYDYDEDLGQGLALIAMEYVSGGSVLDLHARFGKEGTPFPAALALAILGQALEALAEAHTHGVIHRDVTPANLLLAGTAEDLLKDPTRDPQVKLIDFGIAGLTETRGRSILGGGTPAWAAPEVLASLEITPAADVYGAGAVAYFLLTGVPPQGRFEAPSEVRGDVGTALSEFILSLLETAPGKRPAALEAAAAARALMSGRAPASVSHSTGLTPGRAKAPASAPVVPSRRANEGGTSLTPGAAVPAAAPAASSSAPDWPAAGSAPGEEGTAPGHRGRPRSRAMWVIAAAAGAALLVAGVLLIQTLRGRGATADSAVGSELPASSPPHLAAASRPVEAPAHPLASTAATRGMGPSAARERPSGDTARERPAAERLFNAAPAAAPGTRRIAAAIEVSGTSADAEEALAAKLASPSVVLETTYFTRAFRKGGEFARALGGDVSALREAGGLKAIDYVLVGRLEASFSKGSPVAADLVSCRLRLAYRLIDSGGRTVASDSVAITGAGFSDGEARTRALEMLVEQDRARIIGPAV